MALSFPLCPPKFENDAEALKFIDNMTKNTDIVQQNVLAQILTQNGNTEYLKAFNLNGAIDRQIFKSKIPVVTYEDIQPLIKRIANGDRSPILTGHPISEFFISSGTSAGEKKLIPTISEDWNRRQLFYSLLEPVINVYVKGLEKGKGLYFLLVKPEMRTPGGLLAQPVLTSFHKSEFFQTQINKVRISPNEAILCPDSFQSMYTQMLCGLYEREQVLRVGAVFASGLLYAIRFLQQNWQELMEDIRVGALSPKITYPSLRECMTPIIKPDKELADFIAKECGNGKWEKIITRIWPNTKYIDVIVTGSMAQYIPMIDYYSGRLPIACTKYASSECHFGLNLIPMCDRSDVSYTIMPNMAYFEFLQHDHPDSDQELVDLANVEIGKEYELVITTYAGLYRYQVGDILRVTGFHNSAPQFCFVRRKNALLSIDADKTDESDLQSAVDNASKLLREFNTDVVEYTSYADTNNIPGHYVIFLELIIKDSINPPDDRVLEHCCLEMEEALNWVYRCCRVMDKSIGPLEIRVVKNGTFEELMDFAISRDASINQYKVPKCVSFTPIVELLDSRVVSTHFSPSLPHWSPK